MANEIGRKKKRKEKRKIYHTGYFITGDGE
jgi:hypothetical protein